MIPLTAATSGAPFFRRGGLGATVLVGAVVSAAACGGSEPSGEASSTPPEGAGAAPTVEVESRAPIGTGFIMVSEISQLQMTEGTFVEESDCRARVSALGDATAYEGCIEVPSEAICLQVAEGLRESDRW